MKSASNTCKRLGRESAIKIGNSPWMLLPSVFMFLVQENKNGCNKGCSLGVVYPGTGGAPNQKIRTQRQYVSSLRYHLSWFPNFPINHKALVSSLLHKTASAKAVSCPFNIFLQIISTGPSLYSYKHTNQSAKHKTRSHKMQVRTHHLTQVIEVILSLWDSLVSSKVCISGIGMGNGWR